tara:strand:- start:357 stop:1310 length:954 start_codon:yes stop_codon:yes gene_type:complete
MVDRFHPEKALFPAAVILVFLLLAMFVPPLWVVVGILAPVPLIFVYLRWGRGVGMVLFGLVFGVLFSLVGYKQAVLFFAEYAVLAAVLSETIQFKLSFDKCILFSTLVSAALLIILLLFLSADRESTLVEFFQEQIEGHFQLSMEALQAMGDKPEELKAMREFASVASGAMAQAYLSFITIGILVTAVVNYYMVRLLWSRIYGPGLFHPARFSGWVVPEQAIWVLIGSGGLLFFAEGILATLGLNLLSLVLVVYFLQGLAILIHFLDSRNVPVFFWVLIFFVIVLQPLLIGVAVGLGIFDTWIDLRKIRTKPVEISG